METFNPQTDEVTDILATDGGLHLEELRQVTQEDIYRTLHRAAVQHNGCNDYDEIISGDHPYRGYTHAKYDPMYPHHGWFWK